MSLELKDHYDKIFKYCYLKIKNSQLAEDLTQEAFLRFFSQTSYISRGKPLAYLYTIARNLCIDSYKRNELQLLEENIPDSDALEDFEMSLVIRQAVSLLPEDLQEIIHLRFVCDLSINEISHITGLSRFAIYRRTGNALNKLKESLREEDFI